MLTPLPQNHCLNLICLAGSDVRQVSTHLGPDEVGVSGSVWEVDSEKLVGVDVRLGDLDEKERGEARLETEEDSTVELILADKKLHTVTNFII